MFEDWSCQLSTIDIASADERALRRLLAGLARHRGAVDAFEARVAGLLGEASMVRGASRCTQREADRAVARGNLIEALPAAGEALAAGEISGAHLDTLARAAERTTIDSVAESQLLQIARCKPADAMNRQVSEFVRANAHDGDLAARLARQRRNRRGCLIAGEMGVLHVEWDDTTFADVRCRINDEADRLFHQDGGRDSRDNMHTPEQRRADAVAALILGASSGPARPPAVRNQMVIVAHADGSAHIAGVGPLPRHEVERLACVSDLFGLVFSADGQPLWLGDRVRLATDIDNLALVCKHDHHLIHDKGWRVVRDASGAWTLAPP